MFLQELFLSIRQQVLQMRIQRGYVEGVGGAVVVPPNKRSHMATDDEGAFNMGDGDSGSSSQLLPSVVRFILSGICYRFPFLTEE